MKKICIAALALFAGVTFGSCSADSVVDSGISAEEIADPKPPTGGEDGFLPIKPPPRPKPPVLGDPKP